MPKFHVFFVASGVLAGALVVPLVVAVATGEQHLSPNFAIPLAICGILALCAGFAFHKQYRKGYKQRVILSAHGSFVAVAVCWVFAAFIGALPLYIGDFVPSLTDAVFESVSGFSTTGATVFADVSALPVAVNLWRCEMQWLGGIAFVLFFTATTTAFMSISGSFKTRTSSLVRFLVLIYALLTVIQTALLCFAGMDFWDALSHAFAVMGTGGFSTKTEGIKYYRSGVIEVIITVFMFLAATNFSLYYALFLRRTRDVLRNSELRAYLGIIALMTAILTSLIMPRYSGDFCLALRHAVFHVVSVFSTTGFAVADLTRWPVATHILLFMLLFLGGCSGSSAGGVKIVRWVIMKEQLKNECRKMLHPQGVFISRLNGQPINSGTVFSAAAYLFLFLLLMLITTFVVALSGVEVSDALRTAFSATGNVGAVMESTGQFAAYNLFQPAVKWWLSFVMLAGRLELYALLVALIPMRGD